TSNIIKIFYIIMNTISKEVKESKKIYQKQKKICDNYQKGLYGFCKNCNKLSHLHENTLLYKNWVIVDKVNI
ncbi:unnamed protein product, partial [marine sediment metagenome]